MSAGHPRLPMKRGNATRSDWVDKSLAAFVAKHTNKYINDFIVLASKFVSPVCVGIGH